MEVLKATLSLNTQLVSNLPALPLEKHFQLDENLFGFTTQEQSVLARDDIPIWSPLTFDGKVNESLLLGRKWAAGSYSREKMQGASFLNRHAATAICSADLVYPLQLELRHERQNKEVLKKTHQCLLEVREEERKVLARELHDSCIGDVIGITTELSMLSEDAQSESLSRALMTLRSEALSLLKHLRSICTDLRPPDLDTSGLGLACAIRSYIKKRAKESRLYELDLMSDAGRLPEQVAIALFRIFQEATKNSIKHSRAKKILVELSFDETSCTLRVTDNGDGFELPSRLIDLAHNEHFGLLGMQERAELIGANFKISSKPGDGTIVFVHVPLPNSLNRI